MRKFCLKALVQIAFISVSLLASSQAQAIFEFSFGYNGIASSSSGGNWTVPGLSYSGAYGTTYEARVEIPITSIALGVRYNKLGLDGSQSGQSLTMDHDSYSALVAYRVINTGILLGGVITYGLTNTGSLKNSLATPVGAVNADSVSQYTAGIEVGIKLPFLLAVEAGYGSLVMSGFSNQTIGGSATSVDLKGPYARASFGLSL